MLRTNERTTGPLSLDNFFLFYFSESLPVEATNQKDNPTNGPIAKSEYVETTRKYKSNKRSRLLNLENLMEMLVWHALDAPPNANATLYAKRLNRFNRRYRQ